MTLEQFINIDLESEADPPRFTTNRINEARALAIKEGNVELLTSGKLDDPRKNKKRARKWRQQIVVSPKQKEMNQMYDQLATEMDEKGDAEEDSLETDNNNETSTKALTSDPSTCGSKLVPQEAIVATAEDDSNSQTLSNIQFPVGNNGKRLILPNEATIEELQKSTQPEEDTLDLDEWKQDMPSDFMDEIDGLFRDDDEVKEREAIFNKMNKDYIEKQKQKENERKAAEEALKEQEDIDANQVAEQERYWRKTKRRRDGEVSSFNDDSGAPTTQDALLAAISTRKISRKINYDAMSAIFDDSGNFSTEMLEDNEPVKSGLDF